MKTINEDESYAGLKARIKDAEGDRDKIVKCDSDVDLLYDAGILSALEYERLTEMILRILLRLSD